ncbi:apelin receptor A isoform X1 [Gallus gallus]|nr:apelin receptor A isoform X1 [Gallus gallus]XP_040504147.1 apelin receptor A isoform X1 [Gallus gallus]
MLPHCILSASLFHLCCFPTVSLLLPTASLLLPYCIPACIPVASLLHPCLHHCCFPTASLLHPCSISAAPLLYPCCFLLHLCCFPTASLPVSPPASRSLHPLPLTFPPAQSPLPQPRLGPPTLGAALWVPAPPPSPPGAAPTALRLRGAVRGVPLLRGSAAGRGGRRGAMEYAEADYYYGEAEEEEEGNGTACAWQADWEASFALLPALYALVFVLGLAGNALVLLTVWRGPRAKRRSADAYIGNLALADLAFVATLPLWAAYTALRFHWPFGAALCKLSSYLVLLNMFASAFCLGGLSAERYRAVLRAAPPPPRAASARLRRPAALGPLAALWAAAAAAALPALLLREARRDARNRTLCDLRLGGEGGGAERAAAALSLGTTALGFAAPLLLMAVCYCCVGSAVRRHLRPRRAEAAARRRLLRLIAALVGVFAGCWLPFHLLKSLFVLAAAGLLELPCALLGLISRLHPYATCLAYLNSCLNPLLYAFLDGRFRAQCRALLGLRGARPPPAASSTPSAPTQRSELPSSGGTKV